MKIIVLFIAVFGIGSSPGQYTPLPTKTLPEKTITLQSFTTSFPKNNLMKCYRQMLVINHQSLRSFYYPPKEKSIAAISPPVFSKQQTLLLYERSLYKSNSLVSAGNKLDKVAEVLGGVMGIFFEQYSIDNRVIR